jgi:hypothetical protein
MPIALADEAGDRRYPAQPVGPLYRLIVAPMNSVAGPVCSPPWLCSLFDTTPGLHPIFRENCRACPIGHDVHFSDCQARACDEDRAAIEWARQLVTRYAIELWCGERSVARLEPRPAQ